MRLLHFAIAVAGLVALTTALAAQEPDTLSAAQRAGLALARLGAGQRVRIVTRDSEFVEGSVMAASPNLLRLRTDGTLMDLPASRLDSLCGRGCGPAPFFEGLLIGGTAGALIGALIGAAFPRWQLRVP